MQKAVRPKKKVTKALPIAILLVGLAGAGTYVALRPPTPTADLGLAYHSVTLRSMDVTIKKDGELQAVNNIDISCEVEGLTTINSIVKEGANVKKGDTLVELDSSTIRQRIDDTSLDLEKAKADLVTAKEMFEIQVSQDKANLETAQVTLDGAKIDRQKYDEGDYPLSLRTAQSDLEMAKIDLAMKEADLEQVLALQAKQFLTPTDTEKRRVDVMTARNVMESKSTALKNLEKFDHEKAVAGFQAALTLAEQHLEQVKRENFSNEAQKKNDAVSKEQAVRLQQRKLDKLEAQLAASTIKAPEDGLVVYGTSGDRNAQNPIQEGTQVREKQLLLRLPDTSKMKAVVRIQEAQVNPLREGMRASINITGIDKPFMGTVTKISVLPDNSQRWFNPDLKEYPVDVELDETPPSLKPGRGASVEISVTRLENVVAVPVSTIYGSGSKSYVFVKPQGQGDPAPREVKLGLANETHVQVLSGLDAKEEILVLQAGQGRELLAKAGIADEPATRPTFSKEKHDKAADKGQRHGPRADAGVPVRLPTTRSTVTAG